MAEVREGDRLICFLSSTPARAAVPVPVQEHPQTEPDRPLFRVFLQQDWAWEQSRGRRNHVGGVKLLSGFAIPVLLLLLGLRTGKH